MSAGGVFFTLDAGSARPPELREHIRFPLTFEHADPGGPLQVEREGDVVRIEVGPDAIGVAVSIGAFDFEAGEPESG